MRKSLLMLALLASAAPVAPAFAQSLPSAFTSATRYDALNRVTGTIAPDPDGGGPRAHLAVRNSYNSKGELFRVEKGELAGWQSEAIAPAAWSGFAVIETQDFAYDAIGRKAKETLSAGGNVLTATQYSYDALGRLDCSAVRMNPAAFGALPASACTPGPAGVPGSVNDFGPDRITRNVYDLAGQLLQVREAVGTADEAAEATYSYTESGKRRFVIDGNGNRAELRYDGHDRHDRWVFPAAARPAAFDASTPASALASAGALNENDFEQYGHDPAGNRTSFRNRAGETLGYAYDALNRMTLKDRPGSEPDIGYGYDLRGLQTSAAFTASGQGISNAFDNAGRLTATTSTMHGVTRTTASQYDANGNRTRLTYPDVAALTLGTGFFVTYDHDGLDRVTAIKELGGTAGVLVLASYGYDQLGRRASITRGNGTTTAYSYDGASRLQTLAHDLPGATHDVDFAYGYNPASQIVTSTRSNDLYAWTEHQAGSIGTSVNGLNQLSQVGAAAPTYDAKGNLTSDGTNSYGYSSENQLTSTVDPGGVQTSSTLSYDPLMRLGEVASSVPAYSSQILHDAASASGADVILDSAPTQTTWRYVHGPGTDEPLMQYYMRPTAATTRAWFHADERGSLIGWSRENGPISVMRFDEYGVGHSGNGGRFRYTGQYALIEPGIYYYKTRFLDPKGGRFLQTDTAGYGGGINLYPYTDNDPINATDPTGQFPDLIADIAFIAIDIADIASNGLNATNGVSLGANIVGAAIPGATGLGAGTRALMKGGEAAAKRAENVAKGIPKTKLGPSGKLKVHQKDHSSMKRAEDSSRSRTARGQSPMKHSNPQKGKPHFHATDAKGNKRQDGVHDNYPGDRIKPHEKD